MPSTAATPADVHVQRHHSSRHSQSHVTASPMSVNRTTSTSSRSGPAPSTNLQRSGSQRSSSQSHAYHRTPSSHQATQPQQQPRQQLSDVLPHKDFETSNLPDVISSRRSTSRDGAYAPPAVARGEPPRSHHRTSSRSAGPTRPPPEGAAPPAIVTNGERTSARPHAAPTEHGDRTISGSGSANRRRTTITGQSGQWTLGKTIGSGSMGKVKLAKKLETGEQVMFPVPRAIDAPILTDRSHLGGRQDCPAPDPGRWPR